MSLNNGRDCSHSAISCPVPGSVSVPFPGSAPSTATTPLLFSTPLPPNPDPVDLPANTNNIPIMEFTVPAQAVTGGTTQVQLNATIGTEILSEPSDDAFLA
ncbi:MULTISPECIES: hypothetical protein [Bacillus]|uniref:hypothetical protein n=1 Tax=Bacillus TaxID=1386 RepID=UPI001145B937|nr:MULTISPECIES: hypothetical protein [Bacillus]MCX2824840.1 hypothetical protein [Bacillus sp. DHT2]MDR4915425.1 hypothetical protein [Bacillus pseudomycoides]